MVEDEERSLGDMSVEQWTLKPSPRKSTTGISGDHSSAESTSDASSSDERHGTSLTGLTPRRKVGGILRAPDTPGTGQSVRFGKRLYDDGDESRMSDSAASIKLQMMSGISEVSDTFAMNPAEESVDAVEMSLHSISRRSVEGDGDSGESNADLPTMTGYSNLLEDDISLDESLLRSEVEMVKRSMDLHGSTSAGPASTVNTPHSQTSGMSDYQTPLTGDSFRSSLSPVDFVWKTPASEKITGEERDMSTISVPWASSLPPRSPSAERAGRIDVSLHNQSSFVLLPGAFGSLRATSSDAERKDAAVSSAPVGKGSTVSTYPSDSSLEELLRATQELDMVHFERAEALRIRVQESEEELVQLRSQAKLEQQARELAAEELRERRSAMERLQEEGQRRIRRHEERMLQVDELVGKLKSQLDRRSAERSAATVEHGTDTPPVEERQLVTLKAEIGEELERDWALERYEAQRKHDEELEGLNEELTALRTAVLNKESLQEDGAESVADLRQRNEQLTQEVEALRESVRELEDLRQQSDELRAELQGQWRHSQEAGEREGKLTAELHDMEDKMVDLERQLSLSEGLRADLEASKSELNAIRQDKESLEIKIEEQRGKAADERRIHEAEKDDLHRQMGELQAKQKDDVDALERLAATWKAREEHWSTERRELEGKTEEMERLNEAGRLVTERNASLTSQVAALNESLAAAQSRITDLQLEGTTTSKGIESVRRDLAEEQRANKTLKVAASDMQGEIARLKRQHAAEVEERACAEKRCQLLQVDLLRITEELQNARNEVKEKQSATYSDADDLQSRLIELGTAHTAAKKRIADLERESSDRGMSLVKMQKARRRLEEDNFNFGIALAAKQQELGMLKRKARRSSQIASAARVDETTDRTVALRDMPSGPGVNRAPYELGEEGEDTLPALQRGPAHLKATRRKTIDGKAVALDRKAELDDGRVSQTSPASKAMPPPSLSKHIARDSVASRRSSSASNRNSFASSIAASHGPMELSELFPASENSRSLAGSRFRRSAQPNTYDDAPSVSRSHQLMASNSRKARAPIGA